MKFSKNDLDNVANILVGMKKDKESVKIEDVNQKQLEELIDMSLDFGELILEMGKEILKQQAQIEELTK